MQNPNKQSKIKETNQIYKIEKKKLKLNKPNHYLDEEDMVVTL